MSNDLWTDMPIIHEYTDADAIADGTLVDLSDLKLEFAGLPINRITSALWADYFDFEPQENVAFADDLAAFREAIRKVVEAVPPLAERPECGTIVKLPFNRWMVGNDVGGFTLMWPSDY